MYSIDPSTCVLVLSGLLSCFRFLLLQDPSTRGGSVPMFRCSAFFTFTSYTGLFFSTRPTLTGPLDPWWVSADVPLSSRLRRPHVSSSRPVHMSSDWVGWMCFLFWLCQDPSTRGGSVPMLPPDLAHGAFSLNQGVARNTLSLFLTIKNGAVAKRYHIYTHIHIYI